MDRIDSFLSSIALESDAALESEFDSIYTMAMEAANPQQTSLISKAVAAIKQLWHRIVMALRTMVQKIRTRFGGKPVMIGDNDMNTLKILVNELDKITTMASAAFQRLMSNTGNMDFDISELEPARNAIETAIAKHSENANSNTKKTRLDVNAIQQRISAQSNRYNQLARQIDNLVARANANGGNGWVEMTNNGKASYYKTSMMQPIITYFNKLSAIYSKGASYVFKLTMAANTNNTQN